MDKKERKALADQLALSIAYVLKKTNDKAAQKIHKHISEAAKQLVKRLAKQIPDQKGKTEPVKSARPTIGKAAAKSVRVAKKAAGSKSARKSTKSRPSTKS
ncbi:MAG: hypothetical protein LW707_01220 [Sphingobacteriales bacterium]|jgi:hypothetical protein|nr:hypothetical protein [Sphingobacteriales bacterium]